VVTAQEIAWAAGIYEGEGSVIVPTAKFRTVIVQISQKDPWLCNRFKDLFGGNVHSYDYPPQEGRNMRRIFSVWKCSGPTARGFLMTIYKFLSPRRKERVRAALAERTDYKRARKSLSHV